MRKSNGAATFAGEDETPTALAKHRIPVIDRMLDMLFALEKRPNGATIRDFVDWLGMPRTTVYRILNTLQRHNVVRRSSEGGYRLGPRLLALAASVTGDGEDFDLAALALPHLEALSGKIGEGSKISILDDDKLLVVAVAAGAREYALTVTPGQRLPLHSGAAGKTLLAYLPKDEVDRRVGGGLARYTPRTITDAARLRTELARIRRQGWAQDKGEYSPNVHAFAAPILDHDGNVVAALSVPFIAGGKAGRVETIRVATIAAANAIENALPARRPERSPKASAISR